MLLLKLYNVHKKISVIVEVENGIAKAIGSNGKNFSWYNLEMCLDYLRKEGYELYQLTY